MRKGVDIFPCHHHNGSINKTYNNKIYIYILIEFQHLAHPLQGEQVHIWPKSSWYIYFFDKESHRYMKGQSRKHPEVYVSPWNTHKQASVWLCTSERYIHKVRNFTTLLSSIQTSISFFTLNPAIIKLKPK